MLATLVLFAAGRWLLGRARLRRVPIPAALLLLLAAFGGPLLLTEGGPSLGPVRFSPPPGAPNLLLIVIDTVRADHLDLVGYTRKTAPNLSRLASEGAVFDRAISAATWTLPSHASMFTGPYPSAHGAHHEGNHLAASNTTLAELLHARGYTTVGFNANPWITESNGMAQGFERLEPSWLMMTAPMNFLAYRIGSRLGLVFEDHGELFGEHGLYGHEMSLSERLIHVPLLIRYPRRVPAGTHVKTPVTTVSVLSTALDLLGLPAPPNLQARSLAPLLVGETSAGPTPILSEQHRFHGLVPGTYKVHGPFDQLGVRYRAIEEHADVVARLVATRESLVQGLGLGPLDAKKLGTGGNVKLDPAARERLKSLGYVQ